MKSAFIRVVLSDIFSNPFLEDLNKLSILYKAIYEKNLTPRNG